jgi:chromosome segregation ATPase
MSRTVSREKYDTLKRRMTDCINTCEKETYELESKLIKMTVENEKLLNEIQSKTKPFVDSNNIKESNQNLKKEIESHRQIRFDLERKLTKSETIVDNLKESIETYKERCKDLKDDVKYYRTELRLNKN